MQKINYKRINTGDLWNEFTLATDNLLIEEDLRLSGSLVYKFGGIVLDDSSLDIADIAVDECDVIYLLDCKKKVILSYDKISDTVKEVCCGTGVLSVTLTSPAGIAIDRDTLYIADSGNFQNIARLIALSRSNLQIRWILSNGPEGNPLTELGDLSVGPDGDIFLLEKGEKRVLRIARSGRIVDQEGAGGLAGPTDIAVDKTGNIYVLDGQTVYCYSIDGSEKQIQTEIYLKGFTVNEGQLFAGERGPDDPSKTIRMLQPDGATVPLWSYRGAVKRLINDSKRNIYVIHEKGDALTFLEYTEVNSVNSEGLYQGRYVSKPIDSGDYKNRWHRFLLEGEYKKGSQIDFSYFISDDEGIDVLRLPEEKWKQALPDTSALQGETKRDSLFLDTSEGRYLWFRITLYGDEGVSPRIRALTVFFPRTSYLDFLPAAYQEDPASRDFLERFLSIFESIYSEIDFTIDHITRFFDVLGAPPEFLPWLGSWLSVAVDENWPEDRKRLFIRDAVSLYRKRGTREGLQEVIEFFSGSRAYIVENFHAYNGSTGENWNGSGVAETCKDTDALFFPADDATAIQRGSCGAEKEVPLREVLFGKERFCFCVLLADSSLNADTVEMIRKIIEEQKPAHTCYGLKVLEPWFSLDMHTYLGVNTHLTKPFFVLGKGSVIGRNTVLNDAEMSGQVGRHSRTGIDTRIT